MATDDPPSLDLINDVADRAQECEKLRHWEEYTKLRLQCIDLLAQRYGPDDEVTLDHKLNLAYNYRIQGRFKDAELVALNCVKGYRITLGDHADTACAMNSLSISIKAQGRVEEGLQLDEETLEMFLRVEGEDAKDTFTAMQNLANSYFNVGRHDEAAKLHQKVVDILVPLYGKDNRDTIIAMDMLARDFGALEEWDRVRQLQEEAIGLAKANFGDADDTTLICVSNLSLTYTNSGETAKAIKLMEDALAAVRQFGGDHTEISGVLVKQLAGAYSDEERFEEAEPLFEDYYEWSKRVRGPDHPYTKNAELDLEDALVRSGKLVLTSAYGLPLDE
jgi:tetratricopeptide (TPR) repeat protein